MPKISTQQHIFHSQTKTKLKLEQDHMSLTNLHSRVWHLLDLIKWSWLQFVQFKDIFECMLVNINISSWIEHFCCSASGNWISLDIYLHGGLTFKHFYLFKTYLHKMGNRDGKELIANQNTKKKYFFFSRLGIVFTYWNLKCILTLFSLLSSSLTWGKIYFTGWIHTIQFL